MKLAIFAAAGLLAAGVVHAADNPAADNTDRNERDKSGTTLTPMDQSNSSQDVDLVASVRRSIMEQEDLSTLGKNVKVIANGGNVTLRGPVENAAEKARIVAAARKVTGVSSVDNQLEVRN